MSDAAKSPLRWWLLACAHYGYGKPQGSGRRAPDGVLPCPVCHQPREAVTKVADDE